MTQPPPPPNGSWNPGPGGWPQGYPGGQPGPQWNPQQGWPQTPPPQKRGFAKWIIGGVALVGVIAVTAVVAVSCTKSSGGTDKPTAAPTTSGAPTSDFASANDTGPVSVITEDPSCAPWVPINNTWADISNQGWAQRDPSIPATSWDPALRGQYQAIGRALRDAANQTERLVKLTPHRVMRELYEQFIAYARLYADRIPIYVPKDNELALTTVSAATVISDVCQAVSSGSAAARGPLLPGGEPPSKIGPLGDASNPSRFLAEANPVCDDWKKATDQFRNDSEDWARIDANIPASQWTPDQRAMYQSMVPLLQSSADTLEQLGRDSGNPTWEDFATLAAQYRRAFAEAIPTYSASDGHLYDVSLHSTGIILGACDVLRA